MKKIYSEQRTVELMISLYCRKKHSTNGLCNDCLELKEYALVRLTKCPFGEAKPACKDCEVHCYTKEKRTEIRRIMRYSGPRMLIYSPVEFLKHYIKK